MSLWAISTNLRSSRRMPSHTRVPSNLSTARRRGRTGISRRVHITFCPCARRQYIYLELQVDGDTTQLSLEDTLRQGIQEQGPENIYHITLVGLRDGDTTFYPERIQALGNVLEVADLTEPDYDLDKLKEQYRGTLISEFIGYFPTERTPLETKALYYGIQALLQSRGQR